MESNGMAYDFDRGMRLTASQRMRFLREDIDWLLGQVDRLRDENEALREVVLAAQVVAHKPYRIDELLVPALLRLKNWMDSQDDQPTPGSAGR